jgi:hypothetical protein
MAIAAGLGAAPARAQGIGEYFRAWSSQSPTLSDVACRVDQIQDRLSDQGTVVVKQPDVWSQARMTKFRKEYENTMAQLLTKFQTVLSAQIARSDQASFSSQTALAAAISPLAPGQSLQLSSSGLASEMSTANSLLGRRSRPTVATAS